jgi:hypothetical protein
MFHWLLIHQYRVHGVHLTEYIVHEKSWVSKARKTFAILIFSSVIKDSFEQCQHDDSRPVGTTWSFSKIVESLAASFVLGKRMRYGKARRFTSSQFFCESTATWALARFPAERHEGIVTKNWRGAMESGMLLVSSKSDNGGRSWGNMENPKHHP